MQHLLEVNDLEVKFGLRFGDLTAINGISFSLDKSERMGLVGESGAGKSVTGFAIINLISKPGFISGGRVMFNGRDLTALSDEAMRDIRGNHISMIFQDPMMTLNPVLTIGTQMVETLLAHRSITRTEAKSIALEKLKKVQIPSPEKRLAQYPHEFSGGMRQRIVIAIALLTDPEIVIADEPTTALDVVSQVTEKIAVMYAGKIVESGPTDQVVNDPKHPYTQGLIKALPGSLQPGAKLNQIPGMMPTLTDIPPGCAFNPRCPLSDTICRQQEPPFIIINGATRRVACHMAKPDPSNGTT
ncbi:MAG: ABC transporter ATP-binding protein [Desulfosarcina sp.]|nr:ABC transporter ATP-binding protein [Desulfosarcina sp.]